MNSAATRYWREIAVILAVKVAVLYAIHETWFDHPVPRPDRARHLEANVYGVAVVRSELPEVYDK